jgi:hypothetical protein
MKHKTKMLTSVVIRACEIRNFFRIFSTPTGGLGTEPAGLYQHTGYLGRHNYTKQKKSVELILVTQLLLE